MCTRETCQQTAVYSTVIPHYSNCYLFLFTWLNFISPDEENVLHLSIAAYKVHLYSTALISLRNFQNMSKHSDKCDVAVAEIYYTSTWTLIGWQIIRYWQRSISVLVIHYIRNCTESL